MFERFSDQGRRTVVLASDEARRLGHGHIGTEHLLLGVLRQPEQIAAETLTSLGIALDDVSSRVEEIIGHGDGVVPRHLAFTPRSKRVLDLALRECARSGHEAVGPEHILLALVTEGEGIAAQVLNTLGAGEARVRAALAARISGIPQPALEETSAERRLRVIRERGRGWSPEGTVDPAAWPVCATCGSSLSGAATLYRTVAVTGSEGDDILDVSVVYCPSCGATIGVLPG
jgi:ATP-dependent Clp protease ATP-binding subunit ClpC